MKCTMRMILVWVFLILTTFFILSWTTQTVRLLPRKELISLPSVQSSALRPKDEVISRRASVLQKIYQDSVVAGSSEIVCSTTAFKDYHSGATKPKLLLFYNFPDFYELKSSNGFDVFKSCSRKCELSVNITRIAEAAVVIFYSHYQTVEGIKKQPGQIWVFFSVESPPYSGNAIFGEPSWHGQFNWTMTYRYDSEFWHGYVRTARRVNPVEQGTRLENEKDWKNIFSKKTKMVAWFVSHCSTDSRREDYATELSKHIKVDKFGQCGTLKCNDHEKCREMLRTDYKFYLSFENSFCLDYVTEKLINIFNVGGVIPVVRGGADYNRLFPPNSVIDAGQFASPKMLAKYLLTLADDEDAYIKMLQWSWDYEIQGPDLPLCQLCERLYNPGPVSCVYKNVYSWWSHGTCQQPQDL